MCLRMELMELCNRLVQVYLGFEFPKEQKGSRDDLDLGDRTKTPVGHQDGRANK